MPEPRRLSPALTVPPWGRTGHTPKPHVGAPACRRMGGGDPTEWEEHARACVARLCAQ